MVGSTTRRRSLPSDVAPPSSPRRLCVGCLRFDCFPGAWVPGNGFHCRVETLHVHCGVDRRVSLTEVRMDPRRLRKDMSMMAQKYLVQRNHQGGHTSSVSDMQLSPPHDLLRERHRALQPQCRLTCTHWTESMASVGRESSVQKSVLERTRDHTSATVGYSGGLAWTVQSTSTQAELTPCWLY